MSAPLAQAAATLPMRATDAAAPATVTAGGVSLLAVTANNDLIRFNSATPATTDSTTAITGLQAGETVEGIDFRPATGQLFALGSTSRLYRLDSISGAATQVGAVLTTTLSGDNFGFDFNPTVDRIRVVSDADQNLRLNPGSGAIAAVDLPLAYAAGDPNAGANPEVAAAAYTNSFAGSTTTTLYAIDSALDILVTQNPPNNGTLNTVGALGADFEAVSGFDMTADNIAFAASGAAPMLYTINPTTGASTMLGAIGDGTPIVGLVAMPLMPNLLALSADNELLKFNSATPGTLLSTTPITGLQGSETVLGIDYRPATGGLYALGSTSRLYSVDASTGAATQVGAVLTTTLSGTEFGFDFNPTVDRIRVVSDAEQNLRLNPDTGAIAAVDTNLAYAGSDANAGANPNIVGGAYISNTVGLGTTTLYDIDSALDIVTTQNPPNSGTLNTVGALGVDTSGLVGFDVAGGSGMVFASLTPEGGTVSNLYTVNLSTGAATLIGAIGSGETVRGLTVVPFVADMYALTVSNELLALNSAVPGSVLSTRAISGLQAGETVLGIDFRPATGGLYALGSTSRLYTVDPATAAATQVGDVFTTTLEGSEFGFDFNPVVDRIRVVSDADQNLRFNPDTGAIAAVDTALAYAAADPNELEDPNVVGAAYTNNVAGAASTTLYDIDSDLDILAAQNPPNSGTLNTVGGLGVDTTGLVGFDIDETGNAIAALQDEVEPGRGGSTTSTLYSVNLTTGLVTPIGTIGGGEAIRDIAAILGDADATAVTLTELSSERGSSWPLAVAGLLASGVIVALAWQRRRVAR